MPDVSRAFAMLSTVIAEGSSLTGSNLLGKLACRTRDLTARAVVEGDDKRQLIVSARQFDGLIDERHQLIVDVLTLDR